MCNAHQYLSLQNQVRFECVTSINKIRTMSSGFEKLTNIFHKPRDKRPLEIHKLQYECSVRHLPKF